MEDKYNMALIGMPGSGKSTIGKILSKKLKLNFIDLDEYIEQQEGISINEIFKKGENYFRDIETKCIKSIKNIKNCVIATGGGVVLREENIKVLKTNSIIIFLDRSLSNIIDNIDISKRPLLKDNINKLYKIYDDRCDLYKSYADFIVNNEEITTTIDLIVHYLE